jgi:transposase
MGMVVSCSRRWSTVTRYDRRTLRGFNQTIERIGLEAGPLSQWIYGGLVEVGLAAICVETRHMHAALSARINKTDKNDARGIAQMMCSECRFHSNQ